MTTEPQSAELREVAAELAVLLKSLSTHLIHGDTYNVQHGDFCDRARQFAGYINSATTLSDVDSHGQAFCLLRSALEHWVFDSVMMLGDRFVRIYGDVPPEDFKSIVDRWRRGDMPGVASEPELTRRNRLRIVHRGLSSQDGSIVLHPLYFEAENYDPFFGSPAEQGEFADWMDDEDARAHAEEQGRRRNTFFRWASLLESLVLNDLVEERHTTHLRVHYRFMSAFVHSYKAAHEALERGPSSAASLNTHVARELALLYSNQFAARYALAFIEMTQRPPSVGLAIDESLRALAIRSLELSCHLWFLEDEPQLIDRGDELLARAAEERTFGPGVAVTDPMALAPSDIRYYREPLGRLRRMHTGFRELATGFEYRTPWDHGVE